MRRRPAATSSTLTGFGNSVDEAERAKPLALLGVVAVDEADDGDAVPQLLRTMATFGGIGELAGEHDEVGFRALDLGADVVERARRARSSMPSCLEERVDANRGLDVVQRDEDVHARRRCTPWSSRRCRAAMATAWSMIGSSAASPSFTPLVEPGRLTMSVLSRDAGNAAAQRRARKVCAGRRRACRSAMPGASRSSTARVASGVTSRALSPCRRW